MSPQPPFPGEANRRILQIAPGGRIRTIYHEAVPLHELGRLQIRRGSHVEPTDAGLWTADLSPVGGPLLGPFPRRSEALAAEFAWLQQHWLATPAASSPGQALS